MLTIAFYISWLIIFLWIFFFFSGPKVMAMIIKGPVLPHVQQMAKRVLHTFIGAADPIDIVLKEKSGQRIPVRY